MMGYHNAQETLLDLPKNKILLRHQSVEDFYIFFFSLVSLFVHIFFTTVIMSIPISEI